MMASVDLDVALEIITEGVQLARVFTAEARDEFREHVRDQVLASKGEGCGDLVREMRVAVEVEPPIRTEANAFSTVELSDPA
jgi:hypothetical protein